MTAINTSLATIDPSEIYPIVGELTSHDTWSRDRLIDQQERGLHATLRHAVETSPYYRDVLGSSMTAGSTLEALPILTKATLMEQWDRIVTDPRLRLAEAEAHMTGENAGRLLLDEYRVFATSGTTG